MGKSESDPVVVSPQQGRETTGRNKHGYRFLAVRQTKDSNGMSKFQSRGNILALAERKLSEPRLSQSVKAFQPRTRRRN